MARGPDATFQSAKGRPRCLSKSEFARPGYTPAGPASAAGCTFRKRAHISVLHYFVRYVWDRQKAESNARKHRIRFEEALTVFRDPMVALIEDFEHGDDRYIAIGMSAQQRMLFVVHIELSEKKTRIISARRASSHERRLYEEGE